MSSISSHPHFNELKLNDDVTEYLNVRKYEKESNTVSSQTRGGFPTHIINRTGILLIYD